MKRASGAKRIIVASKVKMTMIHEAFFTIFALLVACLDVGILLYAWNNSQLSVGAVVALISLIDNAYTPIAIFNVIYIQYKLDKTAWKRFAGLLDLKEDRQLQEGGMFHAFSHEIRVENVSFSYGNIVIDNKIDSKNILNHVNLTIRKGEKVAFVGESGSGKSTLAKILIGLLKYESGEILIDDKPLRKLSLESLYEKVSYLSQDTPVFDGTIRENLVFDNKFSDNKLSDDALRASLEATQLLPLLESLDSGLDTRIGEKGTCLSGGEKQRLALARLWFDHAEIVILDEATSALDNVTESIVMKNVLAQVNDAAVIAIAHRLASIRDFDKSMSFGREALSAAAPLPSCWKRMRIFKNYIRRKRI